MPEYREASGREYRRHYRYREYVYHYGTGPVHRFDRQAADTYEAAPRAGTTETYDASVGSSGVSVGGTGHGGRGFAGLSSGGKGPSPEGTHEAAPAAPPVTPFSRLESEGPIEECYGLITQALREARPIPLALPGIAYGPNEGSSADVILWLTNIFGHRVPVNVGFAEEMINFQRRHFGVDGIKRPDHVIRPKYGIVTYQDKEALAALGLVKAAAKRAGMTVNAQEIKVHRSEKEIKDQLDAMGLLPQDAAAAILFGLVAYGRRVSDATLAKAAELGIMSINATADGVVILPTPHHIFRIETHNPDLDGPDAGLIKDLFSHLGNVEVLFGTTRRGRKERAVQVIIGVNEHNQLTVTYKGKSYLVNKNQETYTLEPIN